MRTPLTLLALGLTIAVAGCGAPAGSRAAMVQIKGSDTMVHLTSAWAQEYSAAHADAEVAVTGGGSGTGVSAMLNGSTDICMSSRDISESERSAAEGLGLDVRQFDVALDGIAVVVHPSNPINALTIDQIADIYTGRIANWSVVGGPDERVVLLSRESNSGTYAFFQEHVLDKEDYATSTRLLPATSAIIQSVGEDAGAIGYVGLGYADEAGDRVKVIGVKADEAAQPVVPSLDTVRNGAYPIARPLHFYTARVPEAHVQAFIDYCLGPEGQETVKREGYVPVG